MPKSIERLSIPAFEDLQPSALHSGDRIWTETNCYADLIIELLNALGHDPRPAFAAALSAGFDGDQWTFLKPWPDDLRVLYGLDVAEITPWRPLTEHIELALARGELLTIEVDSWWLPDTAGTDYRTAHVKTSIVPLSVDAESARMTYLHNAGVYELSGEDYENILRRPADALAPYVEMVRRQSTPAPLEETLPQVVSSHLQLASLDALSRLAEGVHDELPRIAEHGSGYFHAWSFANLRQCGSTAELAADLCDFIGEQHIAALPASVASDLRTLAETAKRLQFVVARAARGRSVSVDEPLAQMDELWRGAIGRLQQLWAG